MKNLFDVLWMSVLAIGVSGCHLTGSPDPFPSANPSSSMSVAPSQNPTSTLSASGTTIPSASQIIDSGKNVWTLSGGVALENGVDAGYSANVILLLYYDGVIYQENSVDNWWSWTSGAWVSVSSDPRGSAPVPSPTPTPTSTSSSGFSYNSAGSNPNGYNIGMNSPFVAYWNNAPMYVDVTYQMCANNGPWDVSSGSDAVAPLDSTGAPTVAAWAGFTSDYPSGQYTLSWQGTGSVSITGATMGTPVVTTSGGVQKTVVTATLTQNPGDEAWTYVSATPPVTNIHLMAPSSEQVSGPGSIFMKDYLAKMAPFSTDRFMIALNTNGNAIQNWSQRTQPTGGSRGTPQGMAYEDIIAFANETGKDIWINVPGTATDDYVCRMARLFLYGESGSNDNGSNCNITAASAATAGEVGINSTSHIYVEYSNEIWNWGFESANDLYCWANGGPASGHTCPDGTSPPSVIAQTALSNSSLPWSTSYSKGAQMGAILTKRDNDIFKQVFGSRSSQIKTVINVQSANAPEVDPGLSMLKQAYGSATGSIDYMAVAPYDNVDSSSNEDNLTDLFADLEDVILPTNPEANGDGNDVYQWIEGDLSEANAYGLPLIAYEGGEGLFGYSSIEITAQTQTQMYTFYQNYFAVWNQLVGKSALFNQFSMSGDTPWGALVSLDDPGSQKWDALMSLILIPGDANGDGVVDQSDCAIVQANYGKTTNMWWSTGDFNHDGVVNAADLAILNAHITGAQCAAP